MTIAKKLGDAGAAVAAQHADAVSPGWTSAALALFNTFVRNHGSKPFLTEDVRAYAERSGLAPPPDSRAWGALAKTMRLKGRIRRIGYGSARTPRSHAGPRTIWRAA